MKLQLLRFLVKGSIRHSVFFLVEISLKVFLRTLLCSFLLMATPVVDIFMV